MAKKRASALGQENGFGPHNTELLVVIAVIGILFAIFVPQCFKYREYKAAATAQPLEWYEGILPISAAMLVGAVIFQR